MSGPAPAVSRVPRPAVAPPAVAFDDSRVLPVAAALEGPHPTPPPSAVVAFDNRLVAGRMIVLHQ
jgi:hypothetical protein